MTPTKSRKSREYEQVNDAYRAWLERRKLKADTFRTRIQQEALAARRKSHHYAHPGND